MNKIWQIIPRDFSTVTIFNLAARALQLVVTVILVRVLTVEEYAGYTVFFTTSSTILGVAGQSIALAYVRYNTEKLSRDPAYKDSLVIISHGVNFICLVLLLAGLYPLSDAMGVGLPIMMASILYGFLLGEAQLNIAFFQSREMYAKSGIIENAKQLTLLAFISVAIVLGAGSLGSILIAYCASGVVCCTISLAMISRVISKGDASVIFDTLVGKEFLRVSVWLILYSVTTQLYNQVNITMLSALGSSHEVAQFGVASRYFNMILLLLPSIKTVLRVRMSKAEMTDSSVKQLEFASSWLKKMALPFAAIMAACCICAQLLFPLLNGTAYNDAIFMFQVLCVNAYSAYVFAPASALIMSLNRYGLQFIISLGSLVINLFGNMLLIPLLGGVGTAIATTISQVILNVLMTIVVFGIGNKQLMD